MSDERFARQYRFELPSGFPLTSPCTSIVHHLSGPNIGALAGHRPESATLRLPCVLFTRLGQTRFLCASGFATLTLARMLDSLVRVSRRVGSIRRTARSWPDSRGEATGSGGGVGLLDSGPDRRSPGPKPSGAPCVGARAHRTSHGGARPPRESRINSLASNDFTYYFTFISKFFSSFPHGTCSLSVSRKYLALEGHYLPVSAAIPSNTTHGEVD